MAFLAGCALHVNKSHRPDAHSSGRAQPTPSAFLGIGGDCGRHMKNMHRWEAHSPGGMQALPSARARPSGAAVPLPAYPLGDGGATSRNFGGICDAKYSSRRRLPSMGISHCWGPAKHTVEALAATVSVRTWAWQVTTHRPDAHSLGRKQTSPLAFWAWASRAPKPTATNATSIASTRSVRRNQSAISPGASSNESVGHDGHLSAVGRESSTTQLDWREARGGQPRQRAAGYWVTGPHRERWVLILQELLNLCIEYRVRLGPHNPGAFETLRCAQPIRNDGVPDTPTASALLTSR